MYTVSYTLVIDEVGENPARFITVLTCVEITEGSNPKSTLEHTQIFNSKDELASFLLGLLIDYPFSCESLRHSTRIRLKQLGLVHGY